MSQDAIGNIGAALADLRVVVPHADRDKTRCHHANRPRNVLRAGEDQVPASPLLVFADSESTVCWHIWLSFSSIVRGRRRVENRKWWAASKNVSKSTSRFSLY